MEKIKKVLLVVNPISGDLDKEKLVTELHRVLKGIAAELIVFNTTGENDVKKLEEKIKETAPSRVLVAGGDGTIKILAEALKDFNIPLGILPAGSANGLALNLKIPEDRKEQIEIALCDNFIEMDILCLNNEISLHISDLGINAELIKNYESSAIRGKFGYLLQSIPTLVESDYPFNFEIETENGKIEREGVLLGFANARKYGTGATVNPKGKMNDGMFELLIYKNLNPVGILKTLREENELDPDFVEILKVSSAKVHCKIPIAFQIDGEFIGEIDSINAHILPEKLKVAVSKKCN